MLPPLAETCLCWCPCEQRHARELLRRTPLSCYAPWLLETQLILQLITKLLQKVLETHYYCQTAQSLNSISIFLKYAALKPDPPIIFWDSIAEKEAKKPKELLLLPACNDMTKTTSETRGFTRQCAVIPSSSWPSKRVVCWFQKWVDHYENAQSITSLWWHAVQVWPASCLCHIF